MQDPNLKTLLRDLVETYNKNEEYLSIYQQLKDTTAQKVDALVSYIKQNY